MAEFDDRRVAAYSEATSLTQAMLDETYRGGENQIEAIAILTKTVDATTYTLRFADRPKYVGDNFYEGRATFPEIQRTLGELLNPKFKFSEMEVKLGNIDGFYNQYLPGGADFFPFIGATLQVKIGLRDVDASFITIFDGFVPEEGGLNVQREHLTIKARDKNASLNVKPPLPIINDTDFPSAPQESYGKLIPWVTGDWEAGYNMTAAAGTVSITSGGTNYDVIVDAPNTFYGGTIGYYVGGPYFVFSIGTFTPDTIADCHIKRGNQYLDCVFNATPQNTAGYWSVQVTALNVSGGGTIPYVYQTGDVAAVKVKVPYDTGKYDNIVEQAEKILLELTDLTSGDLDTTSWTTYKTKSTPAQSDFTSIKGRTWIGKDRDTVLEYVSGLFEQVRLEMFVNLSNKWEIRSLHPEDFTAVASMDRIEQIEIDEDSVRVKAEDRNFFNEAAINYAFTPLTGENELQTIAKKNQNSIDRSERTVSKAIDCPNLFVEADADNQLVEFLRFYSADLEYLNFNASWVHLLKELGDQNSINYMVGSLDYNGKPGIVREIGVNLANGSVKLTVLSLAKFPYTGYSPSNASKMLSSSTQAIVEA